MGPSGVRNWEPIGDGNPGGGVRRWGSGNLKHSTAEHIGRTRPPGPTLDEPEKRYPHTDGDRRRAAAGLVVLLLQRRHPWLQAGRHLRRGVSDQRRQRQDRADRRQGTAGPTRAEERHQGDRQLHQGDRQVPDRVRGSAFRRFDQQGHQDQHRGESAQPAGFVAGLHAASADARRPLRVVLPDADRRSDGLRIWQVQGQAADQRYADDHLRRCRRCRRGGRRALRDQGFPAEPGSLPGRGRQDPQGRTALRSAGNR